MNKTQDYKDGYKECPRCKGDGWAKDDEGEWIVCPKCKGWGYILEDN